MGEVASQLALPGPAPPSVAGVRAREVPPSVARTAAQAFSTRAEAMGAAAHRLSAAIVASSAGPGRQVELTVSVLRELLRVAEVRWR